MGLKACAILCAGALPAIAQEAPIGLPSGRVVTLHDVIEEPDALRFRFLEPDLAMVVDVVAYERLEADMRALCEGFALDRIEGGRPETIVISIADRPVAFGTIDPEAAQVFERYRVEGETCVWEGI